jgi:hypothetical protein
MKVSTAIKQLQDLNPDEEIVINWFNRSTFEDFYNDEEPMKDEQWASLMVHFEKADQYWASNHYAIEEEIDLWKEGQEDNE